MLQGVLMQSACVLTERCRPHVSSAVAAHLVQRQGRCSSQTLVIAVPALTSLGRHWQADVTGRCG